MIPTGHGLASSLLHIHASASVARAGCSWLGSKALWDGSVSHCQLCAPAQRNLHATSLMHCAAADKHVGLQHWYVQIGGGAPKQTLHLAQYYPVVCCPSVANSTLRDMCNLPVCGLVSMCWHCKQGASHGGEQWRAVELCHRIMEGVDTFESLHFSYLHAYCYGRCLRCGLTPPAPAL